MSRHRRTSRATSDRGADSAGRPRSRRKYRRVSRAAPASRRHLVAPHLAELTLPHARSAKIEDSTSPGAFHELLECSLDRSGVGLLTAQACRLGEQVLPEHKIRTFHTHHLHRARCADKGPEAWRLPRVPRYKAAWPA